MVFFNQHKVVSDEVWADFDQQELAQQHEVDFIITFRCLQ
jgi:hypothetical protein